MFFLMAGGVVPWGNEPMQFSFKFSQFALPCALNLAPYALKIKEFSLC